MAHNNRVVRMGASVHGSNKSLAMRWRSHNCDGLSITSFGDGPPAKSWDSRPTSVPWTTNPGGLAPCDGIWAEARRWLLRAFSLWRGALGVPHKFLFPCFDGYKNVGRKSMGNKIIIFFWQKRAQNYDFYSHSTFLSSCNLTGGSDVRGKASPI
jgi:hypothetical protein